MLCAFSPIRELMFPPRSRSQELWRHLKLCYLLLMALGDILDINRAEQHSQQSTGNERPKIRLEEEDSFIRKCAGGGGI